MLYTINLNVDQAKECVNQLFGIMDVLDMRAWLARVETRKAVLEYFEDELKRRVI
jgi:hypothetical protein